MLNTIIGQIASGRELQFAEAFELATVVDPAELYQVADELRERLHKNTLDLCSNVNAKSGQCSEDCKFCAQSAHHAVEVSAWARAWRSVSSWHSNSVSLAFSLFR